MQKAAVHTDESLRSKLGYGEAGFPFSCYLDTFTEGVGQSVEWHWHEQLELSYVKAGAVNCCVGSKRLTLHAGEGIFINSGAIHRFDAHAPGLLVNYIFSPEFIAEQQSDIYQRFVGPVLRSGSEYRCITGQNTEGKSMVEAMEELYRIVNTDEFGKELRIRMEISRLWLCLAEVTMNEPGAKEKSRYDVTQARLHTMLEYIHRDYSRRLTLADIAASANISKSEALRCFRKVLNTTPVKYLNDYRLTKAAKRLLLESGTISDLAGACGFESSGYFCKAFREKYDLSPRKFRMQGKL